MMRFLCLLLLVLCYACGTSSRGPDYTIGVDPSWRGVSLLGKEDLALAFSTELLQAVGKSEQLRFDLLRLTWDSLLPALQAGQCQAILSPIQPYLFNANTYDFSEIYLETGPVLVTASSSDWTSLSQLGGREIAVVDGIQDELLLEKNPEILIRHYDSIPRVLSDVAAHVIDGVLLGVLTATSYVQDLYSGQLKIATPPLREEGLRLITLHGQATDLIEAFNAGLEEAHSSGEYTTLQKKWGL